MASFNKVLLMGNLTRDPELRYTASGAAVASFGLAVNRKFKQGEEWKDEVCFVDITVWAKQGENCAQGHSLPHFLQTITMYSKTEKTQLQAIFVLVYSSYPCGLIFRRKSIVPGFSL